MDNIEKLYEMIVSGEVPLCYEKFDPTDTEGWNLEGTVEFFGKHPIELFYLQEDSYEMQVAKQLYAYLHNSKIWLDDVRPAPDGYLWCKSVNEVKKFINSVGMPELIDFDHDAGDYVSDGGDYIKLMDWMEENKYSCGIKIHSANPVGVRNMKQIAIKNGWKLL